MACMIDGHDISIAVQDLSLSGTVPVSCNLDCGCGCPLTAEIDGGRIVRIGLSTHAGPFMRGCAKGFRIPELLSHPGRLTVPLIRSGPRGSGSFRPVSWDEALALAAQMLEQARDQHGYESILQIGGSGSCRGALHNTALLLPRFLALYGGYTAAAGNYSSEAADFINPLLFGTREIGIDVRTLFDSAMILLWGFNPHDTRFGSETEAVFNELAQRGIPMTVIDPRRTGTVDLCRADWLPLRPGSDSALAAAMVHQLLMEPGRVDRYELRRRIEGADELCSLILGESDGLPKDPQWAEQRCGIPARRICDLARGFSAARPAAVLPGLALQRNIGGEETNRYLTLLQAAAGNAGVRGGSIGAAQWNRIPKAKCGRLPVPENPAGSSVPVCEWADAVLGGRGEGYPADIALVYNVGGNFAVQSSDSRKVRAALAAAEGVITHELFLTPTALWSDIVFPVAMFPERTDICFTNNGMLLFSAKAAQAPPGVVTDYEVLARLAGRLGFEEHFTEGLDEAGWLKAFLAASEVDDFERFFCTGMWEGAVRSDPTRLFVGLSDFFRDPAGNPLTTPSGRIELVPSISSSLDDPHREWYRLENIGKLLTDYHAGSLCTEKFPLQLITPHERYRLHSQFGNVPDLARRCDDRLVMHPVDAAARGIAEADSVVIESFPGGTLDVKVRVAAEILPGTVSLKSGYYRLLSTAAGLEFPGTNTLTDSNPTLPSRGTRSHSNAVEVRKAIC